MAILSNGSKLSYRVGESGSYNDICIISAKTPQNTAPKVDVTCLTSGTMQYIAGTLVELNTVTAEVFVDCDQLEDLEALVNVDGVNWQLTLGSSACILEWTGYLNSFPSIDVPEKNNGIKMTLEIQMQTDFSLDTTP